jgi:hypothetical protein
MQAHALFRQEGPVGYILFPRWRKICMPFSESGFFLMDTACKKDSNFFPQSLDDLSEQPI